MGALTLWGNITRGYYPYGFFLSFTEPNLTYNKNHKKTFVVRIQYEGTIKYSKYFHQTALFLPLIVNKHAVSVMIEKITEQGLEKYERQFIVNYLSKLK